MVFKVSVVVGHDNGNFSVVGECFEGDGLLPSLFVSLWCIHYHFHTVVVQYETSGELKPSVKGLNRHDTI